MTDEPPTLRSFLRHYLGQAFPELGPTLRDLKAFPDEEKLIAEVIHFAETWRWRGQIKVTHRDLAGAVIAVEEFPNTICDVARTMIRDVLAGNTADGAIGYGALGSGATTPATSDTILTTEQFRKQITTQFAVGANGLTTTTYIAPSEACSSGGTGTNFTIQEIGWFAGPNASATPGSGTLVAHVLYNHAKTALESLEIDRTDTFS
jgi:hypothetical protein